MSERKRVVFSIDAPRAYSHGPLWSASVGPADTRSSFVPIILCRVVTASRTDPVVEMLCACPAVGIARTRTCDLVSRRNLHVAKGTYRVDDICVFGRL